MSSSIKQRVDEAMKAAMRAQEKQRLGVIRLILSDFKQKEVDARVTITDEIALQILDKMAKQRHESIKQFQAGRRDDLVAVEEYELKIIQEFLPAPLSAAEVQKLITEAIKQTGATAVKDMGQVMAILKPQLQGRADMGEVGKTIKSMLAP